MRTNRSRFFLLYAAAAGMGIAINTASAQGHDVSLAIAVPGASFLLETQQAYDQGVGDLGNDIDGIGTAVDVGRLDQMRGGESKVDNDVLIKGTVDDNTADHVISGSNSVSDGAFTNASGINTVIQNTGSNVLIQNGMVVNVQFVAPTP